MGKTNKEIALETFKNNSHIDVLYITKDGQPFKTKSDALNSVAKEKNPEQKKLDTFKREDLNVPKPKQQKNRVTDALSAIKSTDDVAKLNQVIAKDPRPFVVAQAKKRLAELAPADDQKADNKSAEKLKQLEAENKTLRTEKADALKKAGDAEKALKDAQKVAKTEASEKPAAKDAAADQKKK